MGAVIGNAEYKVEYVSQKVSKWIQDIESLAAIGKDEPQAAYSSYTKAISRRWQYVQRTIPDISQLFQPLETAIRDKLIPVLVGRQISDVERRILALPVRMGGMGIENPVLTADAEYTASTIITDNLANIIYRQEINFDNYDKDQVERTIKETKVTKENRLKAEMNDIMNNVTPKLKRTLELAQEKGAGAWLTATPIQSLGFALNKQQLFEIRVESASYTKLL